MSDLQQRTHAELHELSHFSFNWIFNLSISLHSVSLYLFEGKMEICLTGVMWFATSRLKFSPRKTIGYNANHNKYKKLQTRVQSHSFKQQKQSLEPHLKSKYLFTIVIINFSLLSLWLRSVLCSSLKKCFLHVVNIHMYSIAAGPILERFSLGFCIPEPHFKNHWGLLRWKMS